MSIRTFYIWVSYFGFFCTFTVFSVLAALLVDIRLAAILGIPLEAYLGVAIGVFLLIASLLGLAMVLKKDNEVFGIIDSWLETVLSLLKPQLLPAIVSVGMAVSILMIQ